MKRPAQGAALIGLAPVSHAFFRASSGIRIMSEVGVEMILPSSGWVMFLDGARVPHKCEMLWASWVKHHSWGLAGEHQVYPTWLGYTLLEGKRLMFAL